MNSEKEITEHVSNIVLNQDQQTYNDKLTPESGNDYLLYSPYVVGYSSEAEQQYMFLNLLMGFDGSMDSLLDIGCGRADLYEYITKRSTSIISYQGIDHNPNMNDLAKQKYNIDIINDKFETAKLKNADWVVASGFFTPRRCETESEDLQKLFKDIDKMYSLANNVVSFNMLSPIGNEVVNGFFYVHPGLIMDMLIEKYRYVTVKNNYSEDVYTVTIYKF